MKRYIALLLVSVGIAYADPVTLTNSEAARLFAALRSTASGTTGINTRNGALNINALRPFVEAFESGSQVLATKANKIAENDPARVDKIEAVKAEATALSKAPCKLDLVPMHLSDDEIRDAKVTMDALSEFIRFLSPKDKKAS